MKLKFDYYSKKSDKFCLINDYQTEFVELIEHIYKKLITKKQEKL